MVLLIIHEYKSKETEAKRGEVAKAKARNGQRDARLRKVADAKYSTPRSLSQTQANARV
jgi:hypothetical protein